MSSNDHPVGAKTWAEREGIQKSILTADGKTVFKGDRVYNYYDRWWGVIKEDPDNDGWFYLEKEGEPTNCKVLNGERISLRCYDE